MVFSFIADYLQHRFSAKTLHGTHSPFVYTLADKVIYNFAANADYKSIEQQRKKLFNDHSTINITDLGAGSHLNNKRKKQIRQIAKNALKSPKLAQLIFRLAKNVDPKIVVELGTCLGITTAYLAKACPNARIISIEGCPETAAVAKQNFKDLELKNIELHTGNFDFILPDLIAKQPNLDLVYVDGNHRKEATTNYFKWCLPKISENSLLIFDDIYWSKGMKEAWSEIKNHPDVTLTIDLFWIGLVYFRKGQAKQHFKLKI